jgi:integrase
MRFQAKIENVIGDSEPDQFDYAPGKRPPSDFVVARDRMGSTLSCFGDLIWDRTPYCANGKVSKISFKYWGKVGAVTPSRLRIADDLRWIMFILIYVRPGASLSHHSILGHITMLRALGRFCECSGASVPEVFGNFDLAMEFLGPVGDSISKFAAVAKVLRNLDKEMVGFAVMDRSYIDSLRGHSRAYKSTQKQVPPMPTKIYTQVLTQLHDEIQFLSARMARLVDLATECFNDPLTGMPRSKQLVKANSLGLARPEVLPSFDQLLDKYELDDLWDRTGNAKDRKGLIGVLAYIQVACALQLQAFTGMRRSEVERLPLDCIHEVKRAGIVHVVVQGTATKDFGGKKKAACWVTNEAGKAAVTLAAEIAELLYGAGCSAGRELPRRADRFLFVSPGYLWSDGRAGRNVPALIVLNYRFARIRDRIQPKISHDDIEELSQIDPHRHWQLEEGFRAGDDWHLTSHQFRRSLALYAQRSGLVSLPSLKRQLQHITQEMTLYYGQGSSAASDIVAIGGVDKDFSGEWNEARPTSQFLAYVIQVLKAENGDLFGGHVNWLHQKDWARRNSLLKDRERTHDLFKKGMLAFVETPIGGCVNPSPCDRNPIDVLHVSCVTENCKNLVGSRKKTERMIAIKKREVEVMRNFCHNLPELVHEEAELEKLIQGLRNALESLDKRGRR